MLGLFYLEHIPGPPLDRFVDRFWYCEGYQPPHAFERVMPFGSASVIVALANDWVSSVDPCRRQVSRGSASIVVGARDTYETIVTADLARLAGVHFRPGGIRAFLPCPASEVGETDLPLELVWRDDAADLRGRLLDARNPGEMLAMFETELRRRFRPTGDALMIDDAVRCLGAHGTRPISDVVACTGLSRKRITRLFREHVGLTPKRYSRVRRFRRAVAALAQGGEFQWADLALECGYFDQAHFIHEFRAFSGLNPTAFCQRRSGWDAHIAADDLA